VSEIVLKTENLSKSYSVKHKTILALEDLNLEIKRGEFVAIMGHSGSGKTTLLNILACLDSATSGKVLLDDIDVERLRGSRLSKVRREKIGFVFQSFNLLPYLNARENVELAMEGTKRSKRDRTDRARELLGMVGLSGREEHRPAQLSAGEQQRVAIARALANNPSVILADEPTGNLDGKSKREVLNLLLNLNLKQGTTVVIVTHDNQVAAEAERVIRLAGGRAHRESKGNLARKKKEQSRHTRNGLLVEGTRDDGYGGREKIGSHEVKVEPDDQGDSEERAARRRAGA
jgi:putative ABC transport system ATP-binding protein